MQLHSWNRWVVLLALLAVLGRATTDADRHRLSAVYYSRSLGLLMLGLPFAARLCG